MAQKGYPEPPPPYVYQATSVHYPVQGQGSTVIVQQQPHVITKSSGGILGGLSKNLGRIGSAISHEVDWASDQINHSLAKTKAQSDMRGLFGQITHELNVLGKGVTREVDWAARQINEALATTASGNILSLFQSGNVIQLVSRVSGRCLEILQGPTSLVVDGLGPDNASHATWTVVNEGANQVRLHNNYNFLAIINGATVLINMPQGVVHGIETKFQLTQHGQFVVLESLKERGRHIGILPQGQLKAALATGKEDHSMFGVRLIYSPYGVASSK